MVKTNTQNPMIHEAIGKIKELNADAIFREQIRQRDKALRDYENDITVSRLEGEAIGEAKNLIENVKTLITNTQKPLAEVLSMLGITQEKYDQSLALLNQ